MAHTPTPRFQGKDELDCTTPTGGDNRFSYCKMPGTLIYYAWGQSAEECPDGPYPGIELIVVSESAEGWSTFQSAIDQRDTTISERNDSWLRGTILGGLGLPAAAAGVGKACIATGFCNWGIGCGVVLLGAAIGGYLVYDDYRTGVEANDELQDPLGHDLGAQDAFELLPRDGE